MTVDSTIDQITGDVIGAAMTVHTALGPGLLESTYETCLEHELHKLNRIVQRQVVLPVHYDGLVLDAAYRIDLLIDNTVVVELKSVEKILPIHEAQLLSYLKLSGKRFGLLINFNVPHLRDGIKRKANGY
jgi:GxxExxY protein